MGMHKLTHSAQHSQSYSAHNSTYGHTGCCFRGFKCANKSVLHFSKLLKHDRIKGINLIFDTTTFVWYYDHYYYLHFVRQCRMQTIRPHPS